MKKLLLSAAAVFMLVLFVSGQAYEGTIEYKKKKRAAFVMEYPYPPDAVENAINQKMEKLGYRAKEEKGLFNGDKGFKTYSHAYLTDISDDAVDYVIKIDRKSKKEDDKSVVYLIAMKGDDDHVKIFDALTIDKAKSFLNDFSPSVEAADLEIKIKSKEDDIAKTEKKLKKLKDDQSDLESKIKKLQSDLEKNGKDQEETARALEDQRGSLDMLKGRRKY